MDTGVQSTIISRSTLHTVNHHLKQQGKNLPPLELPTVRLYGKDGQKRGKKLVITAQITLVLSLGDRSVQVPVFVQPDSEQACLLGINAIPHLGINVSHSDGKPVVTQESISSLTEGGVNEVCLEKGVKLPALLEQFRVSYRIIFWGGGGKSLGRRGGGHTCLTTPTFAETTPI